MNLTNIIISVNNKWKHFTSFLMKTFLRINGAKIGKSTFISISSRIVGSKIYIGKDVRILSSVKIKGREIYIEDGGVISSNALITGQGKIHIGKKSFLGKNSRINLSRDVYIGKDVGFGENSVIWTHGYFPPADEGYPVTYAPVKIDDGAWVSTNIIILPGVTIGKNVIVGAGSVVTKNVPEEVIIAGNPAKVIKKVKEIKSNVEFIKIIEEIIDGYKNNCLIKKMKNERFIKYEFKKFNIYLSDGHDISLNDLNKRGKNILLIKNVSEEFLKEISIFYWFNFNNKIRKRTNYSEVKSLHDYFRSFGIRFLID